MGRATAPAENIAAPLDRALTLACRYLSRRERTTEEVAQRLRREDFDPDVIAQAMAALVETGGVDDARFARLFTEDKRELEQWGSERIRRALIARGIDPDLAASAVGGESAVGMLQSERERALDLLHSRFPEPPKTRRERDRALGVLLRRGYESELAVEALRIYARAGTEDA